MKDAGDEGEPEPQDGRARLRAELLALGRGLEVPESDGLTMAERVLARIVAEGVPAPAAPDRRERARVWVRHRARLLAAALSGLLVVLVLTPPVRAAVMDWFDFGGVEVRYDPSGPAVGRAGEPVPGCAAEPVAPARAGELAGFGPLVPKELGAPDAVSLTRLPEGRSMITLCWREDGRTVRLDEFASALDPYFTKQVREQPEWLKVADGRGGEVDGLWFARPHLLSFTMIAPDGTRWKRSQRTAGPTLLWVGDGRVTLRLEGVSSVDRALEIADSTG
ncbi:hypothetical protein [Streptomyces sp. AC154]|uniref:hypothetical protein n=1 Tax=Streptomyces sp. AC154 TaxID=3143184 RepID=UPI003F7DC857